MFNLSVPELLGQTHMSHISKSVMEVSYLSLSGVTKTCVSVTLVDQNFLALRGSKFKILVSYICFLKCSPMVLSR